jgi:hypothetical protein
LKWSCITPDNKTPSKSNFKFILFYKKWCGHFVHRKLKSVPSKFQFFWQLKNGFIANVLYDGPACISCATSLQISEISNFKGELLVLHKKNFTVKMILIIKSDTKNNGPKWDPWAIATVICSRDVPSCLPLEKSIKN